MIEINLLPESYFKAKRKKQIIAAVIGGGILLAICLVVLYLFTLMNIASLNSKIEKVEKERKEFDKILTEIDNIKKTKAVVKERLDAINELLDSQVVWPLLLYNFNKTIPNNVWLTSLTNKIEAGGFRTWTVDGISLFKEAVADFISNLNQPNGLFRNANLVTLVETTISGKVVYSFKLTFQSIEEAKIKPPKEVGINDVSKTGIYGNTYVNTEYKCSLFVPEGWLMKEDPSKLVLITKEKKGVSEKFTPVVDLVVVKLKNTLTSEEYLNSVRKNFGKLFKNYKEISKRKIAVNNLECFEIVFNWQTKSNVERNTLITLRQKQIYYVKDKYAYVLTFTDVDERFRDNLDDFNIIMSSFKVGL